VPSAESALSDRTPERTLPDAGAATAFSIVEQGPPQMRELAERADARDLSQHPVEERASAPAAASYVEDLRRRRARHAAGFLRSIVKGGRIHGATYNAST